MTFRIRFAKYGAVKFIGHLDVMRYFQKVIRRSELPVKYSAGFNPHQLLSFAQPLGVGITSDGEYMEAEFDDEAMLRLAGVTAAQMRDIGNGLIIPVPAKKDAPLLEQIIFDGMSRETYEGFEILSVQLNPAPKANVRTEKAMSNVTAADYMVSLKDGYDCGYESEAELVDAFTEFCGQESIIVTKKSKKTEKEVDLKGYIYKAGGPEGFDLGRTSHADTYENGQRLFMRLAAGSVVNIRPELVLEAFLDKYDANAFQIHRMETYIRDNTK